MAKILVVHDHFPMPDRASGELRLFTMLQILAKAHQTYFLAIDRDGSTDSLNLEEVARYRSQVSDSGIEVLEQSIAQALRTDQYDLIIFEFFNIAKPYLRQARFFQPLARIVVDSVDVHFQRLQAKAILSGLSEDGLMAKQTKSDEMAVYSACDAVIGVSEDDRAALMAEHSLLQVAVIPNIHSIVENMSIHSGNADTLVFVGGFRHHPNVDAMLFFCQDVLPIIMQAKPTVKVKVIGSWPPKEITDLQSDVVDVLGYVNNVTPYLLNSDISIAPLRYGAGMKGKVGEAMAHGLPVVSTSVGSEGFGLTPDENILIGDNPHDFANQVIKLLSDASLREKISVNGRDFISKHYSVASVTNRLLESVEWMLSLPVRKLPLSKWLKDKISYEYAIKIGWRFSSNRRGY